MMLIFFHLCRSCGRLYVKKEFHVWYLAFVIKACRMGLWGNPVRPGFVWGEGRLSRLPHTWNRCGSNVFI